MTMYPPINLQFEQLRDCVVAWACDRQIIQHSTAQAQFLKAVEELGELAAAIARNQPAERRDAVGDVLVCLINLCAITGDDIVDCLRAAYDEIKNRKGHLTADGVFVKETDE